jgi:hypothetical protein
MDGQTDICMDGWGGTFLFTCNCRRSVTHGRLKVPNVSAMDPFFWADVKSAKEIDCSQLVHKVLLRFFPPVCPLPPSFFYLVLPNHVLGPCYACFRHVMGIRGASEHVTGHVMWPLEHP